jgi:NADH-quinone oxidoreductase subunit J
MMDFQFMAGVQLTLYAGGIVVLIIFSILLTGRINQKFDYPDLGKIAMATIAAMSGLALTLYTICEYKFTPSGKEPVSRNMDEVGRQLMSVDFNGYALPFEVISILLLAAMIGAIIIAKKGKQS